MSEERSLSSEDKSDFSCDDCGQAFSDFLQEMADKNAKVATCPKCGKIHKFDPSKKAAGPAAVPQPARKII